MRREFQIPPALRSWKHWAIGILVVMVLTTAWSVPAWIAHENQRREVSQSDERELLRAHAGQQRELVQRLWATPFFAQALEAPVNPTSILNKRIPWEGGPTETELSFTEAERRALRADWGASVPAIALELDTHWMDDLALERIWNLYVGSPALDSSDFSVRLPQFGTLDLWAKVEIAQGAAHDRVELASRRVRHLAWLELTTSNEVGVASGLAILKREQSQLAGSSGFDPLAPASANEVMRAIHFERSVAEVCEQHGCEGVSRTPLPPALECAVLHSVAWDLTLEHWFHGEDPPPLPSDGGCRFEDVIFLRRWQAAHPAASTPLPRVRLESVSLTLPSRVEIGHLIARALLPWLEIRCRASAVELPSARRWCEPPP